MLYTILMVLAGVWVSASIYESYRKKNPVFDPADFAKFYVKRISAFMAKYALMWGLLLVLGVGLVALCFNFLGKPIHSHFADSGNEFAGYLLGGAATVLIPLIVFFVVGWYMFFRLVKSAS